MPIVLWQTSARCCAQAALDLLAPHFGTCSLGYVAADRYNRSLTYMQREVKPVSMFVKTEGASGRAKIHSGDPKHTLGLAQYLRAIGYSAWFEDTNGNETDEKALKIAIRARHNDAPSA